MSEFVKGSNICSVFGPTFFVVYYLRWKKAGSVINPNLLSNTPTISEGGSKKNKEALSDVVEKADAKFKKIKEMRKDDKSSDDKLCKPGMITN